jgi:hypothetical protein
MPIRHLRCIVRVLSIVVWIAAVSIVQAQDVSPILSANQNRASQVTRAQRQDEWFYTGRIVGGKNAAQLRKHAYDLKLKMRSQRAAVLAASAVGESTTQSSIPWTPLGPVPLASDATGNGTQNYNQVAGRATAVAIDPADPTGNTVYVGGAQAGVWQSINPATSNASSVTWTPLTDDPPTLSIGALAIPPGNSNPANSVILAATGEADNPRQAVTFGSQPMPPPARRVSRTQPVTARREALIQISFPSRMRPWTPPIPAGRLHISPSWDSRQPLANRRPPATSGKPRRLAGVGPISRAICQIRRSTPYSSTLLQPWSMWEPMLESS